MHRCGVFFGRLFFRRRFNWNALQRYAVDVVVVAVVPLVFLWKYNFFLFRRSRRRCTSIVIACLLHSTSSHQLSVCSSYATLCCGSLSPSTHNTRHTFSPYRNYACNAHRRVGVLVGVFVCACVCLGRRVCTAAAAWRVFLREVVYVVVRLLLRISFLLTSSPSVWYHFIFEIFRWVFPTFLCMNVWLNSS